MENSENPLYRNLVILLKIFKDRPNHLAKYLLDNDALTNDFLDNVSKSKKLNEHNLEENFNYFLKGVDIDNVPFFTDYDEMKRYYNNMIKEELLDTSDNSNLEIELNEKLKRLVINDKFEDAAKLRDYMTLNDIKINL